MSSKWKASGALTGTKDEHAIYFKKEDDKLFLLPPTVFELRLNLQ